MNTQNRDKLFFHQTYGLNIQTALSLPELIPGKETTAFSRDQVDVTIRFGKVGNLPVAANSASRYIQSIPEGICLCWKEVGAFLVRGGREIIVEPAPGAEESLLRLFILGTTLAMLLHQRGEVVVLHASVVAISGQAVAFVGAKGAGKSTIAAGLHARGHDLVADDILAVDLRQGEPLALPGFPQFKLWPDSLASLGYIPDSLPQLRPELEKRSCHLQTGFTLAPVPLKRIFILDTGPELAIEPLHSSKTLLGLLPHWYGARFGIELLQTLGLEAHFLQCADLASNVSVFRLVRPDNLSRLSTIIRLVEDNLAYEA